MRLLYSALVCFLMTGLLTVGLHAQSAGPATAELPAGASTTPVSTTTEEEEEEEGPKFDIKGAVDAYFLAGRAPLPTSFTNGSNNAFSLGMANIMFSKEGKVGFMADIAFGPRAEAANGYFNADGAVSSLALIKQLFVTYSPTDALKFTFGNFSTYYGYEVIDAPVNVNYSTSYMFSYGPFYHTGIKANLALSDKFGLMLGVFNDTDTKIDVVKGKHVGAQLSYSSGKLAAYLNYLGGRFAEATEATKDIFNNQIDLTATFAASDKFGLGLNIANRALSEKDGETSSWFGSALYAKYAFSDSFTFGLRAESINDKDGIILGEETITSLR
jgi:Putative beta-barrel porin-2, OmpL-like. bbp2